MNSPLPIHLILLPGLDGTGELFAPLLRRIERMHIHADEPQLIAHALRYPTHDKLDLRQLHHAVEHYIAHNLPEDARYVILGESFSGPVAITVAYAAQTAREGEALSRRRCLCHKRNHLLRRFAGLTGVHQPLSWHRRLKSCVVPILTGCVFRIIGPIRSRLRCLL